MVSVPREGTIRNTVVWESYDSRGGPWYMHVLYGDDSDGGKWVNPWFVGVIEFPEHQEGTYITEVDLVVPSYVPDGFLDCWTVIATEEDYSGLHKENIIVDKGDLRVLEVVPVAEITSTNFSRII